MDIAIKPKHDLSSVIEVPGDKSISHRAVIMGAIASGDTRIENFLPGEDCLSTVRCIRQLGIKVIEEAPTRLVVKGQGLYGLSEPDDVLYTGNSGTTTRLLAGLLAGQDFYSVLTGDASIRRRPMGRVVEPLKLMGARISGRSRDRLAPLTIQGGGLSGIDYHTPVASAQIKSALLLAGLYADGATSVTEPGPSRDHTECMLQSFGARVAREGLTTTVWASELSGQNILVPGDISSAAFFLVAAAIIPGARVTVLRTGLNPTRTGILEVLEEMGASIHIENRQVSSGEPYGDVIVEGRDLKGITVGGSLIPRLIDEIPILAVAAAVARGKTVITDAQELKVKESNRLRTVALELARFGVDITETSDGLIINGGRKYQGATCDSHGDHRIAMACAIMGLVASGKTVIREAECVDISFPGFADILNRI